ncbi:MAG TPA: hypothetical protein VFE35_02860 [Candidatus Cybelea sp.]|jgi:hypothetical protein|nr:hypothetical protein [Candidatus Cybelea sp.]
MMRSARIAVVIVAVASVVFPVAAAARVTGHLFVATLKRPYAILRFPLNDGIPSSTPDFKYPGRFNTITVGPDGSVYGDSWTNQQLVVFAPGIARPVRRINFPVNIPGCSSPYSGPTQVEALAVNRLGDLFVAYTTYFSGARVAPRMLRVRRSVMYPCLGVVAYGPDAQGFAQPKAAMPMGGQYLNGLTMDLDGLLYVANSAYDLVQEYADPGSHPRGFGFLTVGMTYPQALATDPAENLYELDGQFLTKNGVNVYAPGAGHGSAPTSTLLFESAYSWVEDVAVWKTFLYASDINYHGSWSVDVYNASANGTTAPIFSLPLTRPGAWFIATGP